MALISTLRQSKEMINSICKFCCFATDNDGKRGCLAEQFCLISKDNVMYAPGYCRMKRSVKWANGNFPNKEENSLLDMVQKARQENGLSGTTLVLVFDEAQHSVAHLQRSLSTDWPFTQKFFNKIIVADITGNDRKKISLDIIKEQDDSAQILVDLSVNREAQQIPETIRRISKIIKSQFFMVLYSGNVIGHLEALDNHLKYCDTRTIFWYFPEKYGKTSIVVRNPYYGLYATAPYKILVKRYTNEEDSAKRFPFCIELLPYEEYLGFCLSQLFNNCVIC